MPEPKPRDFLVGFVAALCFAACPGPYRSDVAASDCITDAETFLAEFERRFGKIPNDFGG